MTPGGRPPKVRRTYQVRRTFLTVARLFSE